MQANDSTRKAGIIAVVDDDGPLREAWGSVMKAAGFSARTYASAEDFLLSQNWRETGCLILDVRLPGINGMELQRVMANADCQVPIVFVTAHGDEALRDVALKAGAVAFLNKPVRSDVLLKEIERALQTNGTDLERR
jgi:FixJ family two-component response regulator